MNSREKQPPLMITAMSVADVARVLSAALNRRITEAMIRADIEAGAPTNPRNPDSLNLIHYVAWLAREAAHAPGND